MSGDLFTTKSIKPGVDNRQDQEMDTPLVLGLRSEPI